MKKMIFILLGLLFTHFVFSQCACCSSPSGFSGGDVSPANYTLAKRQMMVELYGDGRFFNGLSSQSHSDHLNQSTATPISNMAIGILGFRYGLNSKLNLSLQLPYILIGTKPQSSMGFGDAIALLNYNIYSKQNFVVAAQLGMEWPTGQLMQVDGMNSVATGSGSFDPLVGLNLAKLFDRYSVKVNTFFKYSTKGFNDTYYGNFLANQFSYQYFLVSPSAMCNKDSIVKPALSWSILAQVSSEYLQAQFKEHAMVENTGSYTVLASLGTALSFRGFSVPITVSVPVYQKLNGQQNQTQLRLRIGLTKIFN